MTETAAANKTIPSNAVLHLPQHINEMLDYLAVENKDEWTAIGRVEKINNLEYRITDVVFPSQRNSGALTTVEPGGHGEVMLEADDKGWDASEMYAWIHSHNTMGVFWSGTDYEQMRAMGKNYTDRTDADVEGWHLDFGVCLVVNARGEKKAAFNVYTPIETYYDMAVNVETNSYIHQFLTDKELWNEWENYRLEKVDEQNDMNEEYQKNLKKVEKARIYTTTGKGKQGNFGFQSKENLWDEDDDWDNWGHYGGRNGKQKKNEDVGEMIDALEDSCDPVFAGWTDEDVLEFREYAVSILDFEADVIEMDTEIRILADEFVTLKINSV